MVVVYLHSRQLILAMALVPENIYPCAYLSCCDAAESWSRSSTVL